LALAEWTGLACRQRWSGRARHVPTRNPGSPTSLAALPGDPCIHSRHTQRSRRLRWGKWWWGQRGRFIRHYSGDLYFHGEWFVHGKWHQPSSDHGDRHDSIASI
jgi:hypothetical protein